jgi:long-chain acyl-CoA synthetase
MDTCASPIVKKKSSRRRPASSSRRHSLFFSQVVVVGNGQPYPVALVAPNWALVKKELSIDGDVDPAALAQRSDVRAFLEGQVREHTSDLASFEQIRYVAILPRDLTIEAGELSPTLKVRRRIVEKRYGELVDELYREHATA